MLFGDRGVFAIECELNEQIDGWVFGHILFWLCGNAVGDWEDSTDLKGCLNWIKKFVEEMRDRFERALVGLEKESVFNLLYYPVMFSEDTNKKEEPLFDDIFSRFHISHLGMSSFEKFDLLLIEQPEGQQRCIWRYTGSNEVHECYLPKGEMQRVAKLCYVWLESKMGS